MRLTRYWPHKLPFTPGPHWKPASDLAGHLQGRPFIIMGNAFSLLRADINQLNTFKTMGCNRCLHPDWKLEHVPDYYTCIDRDPYAQVRDRLSTYKGRLVLSESMFDPNISSGGPTKARPKPQPVQPLPGQEWYGYRGVSCVGLPRSNKMIITMWGDPERTHGGFCRTFEPDLKFCLPNPANVAYLMFQLAVGFGCNPIGIIGVDMQWTPDGKTHALGDGNGKRYGAFHFNSARVLGFFRAGVESCRRNGIEVYNLSPAGILSPTVARLPLAEFHSKFARYAEGDVLYPRQQFIAADVPPDRFSREWHAYNRNKPRAKRGGTDMATGGRPAGHRPNRFGVRGAAHFFRNVRAAAAPVGGLDSLADKAKHRAKDTDVPRRPRRTDGPPPCTPQRDEPAEATGA